MTNIQAINLLKGLEQSLDDYCELNDEGKTAFHMAITALEVFGNSEPLPSAQQDCAECPEYDHKTHSCPKYCEVIRKLEGIQTDDWAEIQQTVMEQPTIVEAEGE